MNDTWDVTYSYLRNAPPTFASEDDVIVWARGRGYALEVEAFTDETHFFFRRRNGRRERFMNIQAA